MLPFTDKKHGDIYGPRKLLQALPETLDFLIISSCYHARRLLGVVSINCKSPD